MPKYSTVRVNDLAEKLQVVTDSLKDLGKTLRAATRSTRPKRASPSVLRDAVSMAISTPAGCEIAELWIKFNGVVDPDCIHAAMETVRANVLIAGAGQADRPPTNTVFESGDTVLSHRSRKFLLEHDLMEWVETQNVQKGIAPVRAQVWNKRRSLSSGHATISTTKKGQRQWCKRWRNRWGIVTGRIHCREKLLELDMQEKVLSQSAVANVSPVWILGRGPDSAGTKTETTWWYLISVRATDFYRQRDPKTVQLLKRFSAADVTCVGRCFLDLEQFLAQTDPPEEAATHQLGRNQCQNAPRARTWLPLIESLWLEKKSEGPGVFCST